MKLGVIGYAYLTEDEVYPIIEKFISATNMKIDCIISGGLKGIEVAIEQYSQMNKFDYKLLKLDFSTNSKKYVLLNFYDELVLRSDIILCIWDEVKKGNVYSVIKRSKKANKKVIIFSTKQDKIIM